jgi:peptide/nickel transport system permease protein
LFQYALRRILIAFVTLFGVTLITFSVINMMPGDPAALQSDTMDPAQSARLYEKLRVQFQLDRPLIERYFLWLGRLVQGDFGESFQDGRQVSVKIVERLPATMQLAASTIFLGLVIAVPIGILQAARQSGWFDRVTGTIFYALFAVPSYVGAIVFIFYLGVRWDLLPFRGMESDDHDQLSAWGQFVDTVQHFTLPVVAATYGALAFDSRFIRANLLEVLRQDYVRTARAKGLAERTVVLKHAFRNTFIPLLTRMAHYVPALVSGSVILEFIFNWPGLGRLFLEGVAARDYPVMMASLVISSALVLLGILLADLLYAWADPRISYD